MRKHVIAAALAVVAAGSAVPALADPHHRHHHHHHHGAYDDHGRYYEPRRIGRDERIWRGHDGRYYCRRGNGTTGLVIGGVAGALIGREIDGGRDRTAGTLLGAAGGALLGREIDRSDARCR
jgi:uncharacterized protein YcfJ